MVSDGEKVMTLWVFKVETLPCHPSEATHAAGSVSHIYTIGDSLSSLCDGEVPGLAPGGLLAVRAPRDRSCARRERWGQLSFRAIARGESGCRRSYARYGPIPLPPGAPSGIRHLDTGGSVSSVWDWVLGRVFVGTRVLRRPHLETATGQPTQDDDRATDFV